MIHEHATNKQQKQNKTKKTRPTACPQALSLKKQGRGWEREAFVVVVAVVFTTTTTGIRSELVRRGDVQ